MSVLRRVGFETFERFERFETFETFERFERLVAGELFLGVGDCAADGA